LLISVAIVAIEFGALKWMYWPSTSTKLDVVVPSKDNPTIWPALMPNVAVVPGSALVSSSCVYTSWSYTQAFGINDAGKMVGDYPDANQDYSHALTQAEAALRLAPKNGCILNTFGVALYRMGHHTEARAPLAESEKLNTTMEGSQPSEIAFLAMAQQQVGSHQAAKDTLSRLRGLKNQPRWVKDAKAQVFLRESEELIERKPGAQKPRGPA
jgi:hypothetical protein